MQVSHKGIVLPEQIQYITSADHFYHLLTLKTLTQTSRP